MINFDLLFILIMLAIIIIGYISGATLEFIKILKIYLPFVVVFYISGPFSRIIFNSEQFINIFGKIPFIHNISYINTFVMLLLMLIVFLGAYFIIELFIKLIQKNIITERVTYKLGKYSNRMGGFFGIIRFYIIASILVIPFFMLGLTSRNDLFTNLVLKYPPPYTQIGHFANASEEVLLTANSLSNFLEIVDINNYQDLHLVTNLEKSLDKFEKQVSNNCVYQLEDLPYPNLYAYVNNPCDDKELEPIKAYKGFILWVNDKNIDDENLVNAFYHDYEYIYQKTDVSSMNLKLEKAKSSAIIYQVTKSWLQNQLGDNYDKYYLQNEDKMNLIIDALIVDFANEKSSGLIYDLKQLKISELNKKLDSIEKFVHKYIEEYKLLMKSMPEDMPFSYKLIASKLKEVNFISSLEQSPLLAIYVNDSFKSFSKKNVEFIPGESLYQSLVKIMIPLLTTDEFGVNQSIDAKKMNDFLTSIDGTITKVIITEDFFIEIVYALVTTPYILDNNEGPYADIEGNRALYINYLVSESKFSVEALNTLAKSNLLSDDSDVRVQTIKETLKAGEIDG